MMALVFPTHWLNPAICHDRWMFVMFTYPDAWCFHPSPLQVYYTVFYSMTASFLRRFNPSGDWLCFLAVGILSRKLMDTHYRKVRDNLIQPQLQVETKKALDLYFLAESFPITGQATDWGLHFKLKTSIVVLQCYITAGMFTWCELDQLLYDKTQVQGFWVYVMKSNSRASDDKWLPLVKDLGKPWEDWTEGTRERMIQ